MFEHFRAARGIFAGRAGSPFSRRQHQQHQLTNSTPTDWSSGCHFRRVCRDGSGHVFSSALLRISVVPHKFVSDFRPGGRGSGCHFRPAAGTRRGVVQECGFIKDFSCTAQISLGFQWYRTNFIRISVVPHKFH